MSSSTHQAVQIPSPGAPFLLARIPTPTPIARQVLVRVSWVASGPIDIRQADHGLHIPLYPAGLGGSGAGEVVALGPDAQHLSVGDRVTFLGIGGPQQKTFQEYWIDDERFAAKTPDGVPDSAAVTVPSNFVTVWHALTHDLGLDLLWPMPHPVEKHDAILIWGGASSVGQYALQVLRAYGYTNLVATASARHHDMLRALGARAVLDYRDAGVVQALKQVAPSQSSPGYKYILDCIGSQTASLTPLSRVAEAGTRVASMLPVHLDGSTATPPEPRYSMDVPGAVAWSRGVTARGVRTLSYRENEFLRDHLLQDILPFFLGHGLVVPNQQRVVGGGTLLERAERAREILRSGTLSGERLVWRIAD